MKVDKLPAIIPLSCNQFKAPDWYQTVRIGCDILENIIMYMGFIMLAGTMAFLIFLSCLDVYINARAIKPRLDLVVAKLTRSHQARELARESLATPRDQFEVTSSGLRRVGWTCRAIGSSSRLHSLPHGKRQPAVELPEHGYAHVAACCFVSLFVAHIRARKWRQVESSI